MSTRSVTGVGGNDDDVDDGGGGGIGVTSSLIMTGHCCSVSSEFGRTPSTSQSHPANTWTNVVPLGPSTGN